jgi:hypothetical protein
MPDDRLLTRDILASALCDAMNGPGTWECKSVIRNLWLHRADTLIRELAVREFIVVPMDELEGNDAG